MKAKTNITQKGEMPMNNNKTVVRTLRLLKRKPRISGVNSNIFKIIYDMITLGKMKDVYIKYVNTLVNDFITAVTNKIIKNLDPYFAEIEEFLSKMAIDERFPTRNTNVIARKNAYNSTIKDFIIAYKAYIERISTIAHRRIVNVTKTPEDIEIIEAEVVVDFMSRLERLNELMEG